MSKRNTNSNNKKSDHEEENILHYEKFQKLAARYDLANEVAFFGFHRIWRNHVAYTLAPRDDTKIIDMAAGTGMSTLPLINYIKQNEIKNCHITVCDVNDNMLEVAKKNIKHTNYELVNFMKDNAENSSFEDNSFDAYTISFGVRCCSDFEKVVKEAYRILKPGGKFVYMDFGYVKNPLVRWVGSLYVYYIMPLLLYLVFGTPIGCNVLIETVQNFLDQDAWNRMIEGAGFQVTYENYWFGLIAIHTGIKPKKK